MQQCPVSLTVGLTPRWLIGGMCFVVYAMQISSFARFQKEHQANYEGSLNLRDLDWGRNVNQGPFKHGIEVHHMCEASLQDSRFVFQ